MRFRISSTFLPRDASSSLCNQRLPGRKMKGLSGARNERRPHYGETRFRDEGEKKILIVLNAVAAAYSAIKGSAIKGSEAANGEEVFLREMLLLSRFSQANISMSTSTHRAVDKCTRNLTRLVRALFLTVSLFHFRSHTVHIYTLRVPSRTLRFYALDLSFFEKTDIEK